MRSVVELQADTVVEDEDTRWSGASLSACSGFSGISLVWCGP